MPGWPALLLEIMTIAIIIISLMAVAGLFCVVASVRNAPDGFEDSAGFHLGDGCQRVEAAVTVVATQSERPVEFAGTSAQPAI